jgi:hypothetical protein
MGAVMRCLACGATNKMLLVDVVRDDIIKVPAFEKKIFMCSECRHVTWRLAFSRAKMATTHLPVITTPPLNLQKERVAAPSAWGKAVETLRSRQIDLKERAAAAKTAAWTKAVEKLRSKQAALAEQATAATRLNLAEPLQAPAAPSEP